MAAQPIRRVRVATSFARERFAEIHVHAGDTLSLGHRNQQHPAFIWSATEDGRHGWIPEDYIEIVEGSNGRARREYDSTDLTVAIGEELDVLEQAGDYLLCRNASGVEGWVPLSCVQELEEDS